MDSYKIATFEFSMVVAVFLLGTAVIIIPILGISEQDMWVAALLGLVSGVGYAFFLSLCIAQGLHPLARIAHIFYSFYLAILVTSDIGDILTLTTLSNSPKIVINTIMVLLAAYAVYLGIGVIFRLAGLFLAVSFFVGVLLIIMSVPEMELNHLQPVFDHSVGVIVKDAITFISFPFMELVVFLPVLKSVENQRKSLIVGVLIGGTLVVLIILVILLVLSPEQIKNYYSPTYMVIRSLPSGNLMEAVTVVVWVQTTFFKLAVLHYIVPGQLGEMFNLDYRKIIIPISVLIIAFSNLTLGNSIEKFYFDFNIYPYYAIPLQIGIPLIVLITNRISGRRFPQKN